MDHPKAFIVAVMAARARMPHGARPTDSHVRIARKLAFWGSTTPTHQQLATATNLSRRTVCRALARLHELGLLTWTRRTIHGCGWRAQTSNEYAFSSKPLSFLVLRTSAKLSQPAQPMTGAGSLAEIAARRQAAFAERWAQKSRRPLAETAA